MLDLGAIKSKIIEIERKCKVQFQNAHVKTKEDSEFTSDSSWRRLVLRYDKVEKNKS